tara:strand:- start:3062 stop:3286 length:225 start_codon:yes stop_codon:yes gene_type:complete
MKMFTLLSPKTDEYMSFKVGDNIVLVRLYSQGKLVRLPGRQARASGRACRAEIIKIQEARDKWNELCREGWTQQ